MFALFAGLETKLNMQPPLNVLVVTLFKSFRDKT